jgi:hypothetical protein
MKVLVTHVCNTRYALHRHLVVLSGEADAERWQQQPATDTERSLEAIADGARPRTGRIGIMQRGEI